ncbi:Btz domain-containing protein [Forsythia ovata]|uniref:Btz domain-containing protein n=1 Tax=Forsythia ovata TaxID=205694 RepID=A0ABD1VKD0_9LAMI
MEEILMKTTMEKILNICSSIFELQPPDEDDNGGNSMNKGLEFTIAFSKLQEVNRTSKKWPLAVACLNGIAIGKSWASWLNTTCLLYGVSTSTSMFDIEIETDVFAYLCSELTLMSRREDRYSLSKRQYSRFDREPSPKRSRKDGKPETERQPTDSVMDKDHLDWDQKVPLEASLAKDPKVETGAVSKESEYKTDGYHVGIKRSTYQTKVPESRSYFQYVDRGNAGQVGRSFSRRASAERGWWGDAKVQLNDRIKNKTVESDAQLKDLNTKDNRKCSHTGQCDGYFRIEADPKLPARKRPSFRDQKFPADPKKTCKAAADPVMPNPEDHAMESEKREERGLTPRHFGRRERPFLEEREIRG